MENNYKAPEKSFINLKQLPPLDPDNISIISSKNNRSHIEERNPVGDDERRRASESPKGEDASLGNKESRQISTPRRKTTKKHKAHKTASEKCLESLIALEGEERPQGRAKSDLHEICAANKWKPPLFELCMDEGPSHMKTFTFKVMVEIREGASSTVLECFSAPQSRKKSAANHAAEGALWGLKHLGYFPKNS